LETTDEQFHISIVSKTDGTETMLYTGKWTSSVNYSGVISAAEDAATALLNNATIASLQKQVTELTVKNETLTESLKKKSEESRIIEKATTLNTAASTPVRPSQTSS
jgi:cell division protein FtsL